MARAQVEGSPLDEAAVAAQGSTRSDSYSALENRRSLFSLVARDPGASSAELSIAAGDPPIHVVARKETLYSIARKYGVTVDQLKAANPGLSERIVPGQRITVPTNRHTVVEGDTLYSLSRRYGVSVQALRDANHMGQSNSLRRGQVLAIPNGSAGAGAQPAPVVVRPKKPSSTSASVSTGAAADAESKIQAGKMVHANVTQKIFSGLEHGTLKKVNAVVLHQTDSDTATQTLNAYKRQSTGAHFLIAKDGTLYQTARLNKRAYHVGNIRSRCLVDGECGKTSTEYKILHGKGSYSSRVEKLSDHEKEKSYPERYPINSDALGIEIVGSFNHATETWDRVNAKQNETLEWLMEELQAHYDLDDSDVYFHNEVAYKQEGEAESAEWK